MMIIRNKFTISFSSCVPEEILSSRLSISMDSKPYVAPEQNPAKNDNPYIRN